MCKVCGSEVTDGARFCGACGRSTMFTGGSSRLMRAREGKMIAGICAGFAQHYGWDVTLVRLTVVLAVLLGAGSVLVAYLIAWIVMPKAPLLYMPVGGPIAGSGTVAA